MAVVCDNTYQLSVNGHQGPRNWTNVFHVELLGASPPAVADAADVIRAAYRDDIMPWLTQDAVADSVNYVDLSSLDGESGQISWAGDSSGDDTSGSMSPQTAYLVHWYASGGRAYRNGRSYLPGVAESSVDNNGAVDSGKISALEGGLVSFIGDLFDADLQLCVVSYNKTSNEWFPRSISAGLVDTRTATQRRRNR